MVSDHADPFGTNPLNQKIIGCAIRVHRAIGPGVYENIYAECLQWELKDKGIQFDLERPAQLVYRGMPLKSKYYIDFVVEDLVVVELKAVAELAEIHSRQVISHLKLTDLPVGLLINFNVMVLKDGIRRVVNPTLKRRETEGI